jgi:hypothetical protein
MGGSTRAGSVAAVNAELAASAKDDLAEFFRCRRVQGTCRLFDLAGLVAGGRSSAHVPFKYAADG